MYEGRSVSNENTSEVVFSFLYTMYNSNISTKREYDILLFNFITTRLIVIVNDDLLFS